MRVDLQVKQRWFVEGAAALREFATHRPDLLTVPEGDFYCCPCCMWTFGPDALADGVLTVEHVPPKSVGGREMLLTCDDCNSRAGHQLDVCAASREDVRRMIAPGGTTTKRYKVTMEAEGIPLRGEAWMENGGWKFRGVDKMNHDTVRDQHVAKLNEFAETCRNPAPLTFRVRLPKMSDARANLSWIRSGYLVAFCAFGLPYAMHSALAELRRGLDNPGSDVPMLISRDDVHPNGRRVMALVRDPAEFVMVGLGQYDVLLPSPWNMVKLGELAEAVASAKKGPHGVQLNGQLITFPRCAEYRFR